jgi:hypothetical protein
VRICFDDTPCDDDVPGGYWSALDADQRYWEGRKIKVYSGFCSQTFDELDCNVYYISDFSINANCIACITAKDPLALIDDNTSQCPDQSCYPPMTLRFPLAGELETNDAGFITSNPYEYLDFFILARNFDDPDDIDKISCITHICVDGEVMAVAPSMNQQGTPVGGGFDPPGHNLILTERAVCGSQLKEHKAGARVTPVQAFVQCHVADVLLYLLRECAQLEEMGLTCCEGESGITIDCESIEEFRCKNPLAIIHETIICQPVGTRTLITELARDFGFTLDYDNATGAVSVVCIVPPQDIEPTTPINLCDIVRDSFGSKKAGERKSRVTILHGADDCSQQVTRQNALYNETFPLLGPESVPVCERRKYRAITTETYSSRWFGKCGAYMAKARAQRRVCLLDHEQREYQIQVPPQIACLFNVGDYRSVTHPKVVDGNGNYSDEQFLVTGKCRTGRRGECFTIYLQRIWDDADELLPGFVCGPDSDDNLVADDCLPCDMGPQIW